MNLNLALPWDDKCSPPQTPFLVFYSPQSPTLLFSPATCRPGRSPNYPHLHWVARCNGLDKPWDNAWDPKFKDRVKSDGMDMAGKPPAVTDPDGRCLAYYDPMNFASDICCPVLMNAGLIDPASPPSSVWAVYNRLPSRNKTIIPMPGLAHDWSAEFDRRAWPWLDRQ